MRYHWGLGIGHMHAHQITGADISRATSDNGAQPEEDEDEDMADDEDPEEGSGMAVPGGEEDDWDEGDEEGEEDESLPPESEDEYGGV